jgi:RecA DNA recombination protein
VAALPKPLWNDPSPTRIPAIRLPSNPPVQKPQLLEFAGVFRGHELTRKDRRLSSGLAPLDDLIDGGIPRGRISEITGRAGSGKTSLAASFAKSATHRGEVAAWLDGSGSFDPESMAAAGVELGRMLWASMTSTRILRVAANPLARRQSAIIKAAELVLEAGGFGLVVIDFGETPRALTHASALRIARAAERSGAAVIALAPWRMCGTFAALSLAASRAEPSFSQTAPGAPVTFDGLTVVAMVARNKMGGTGRRVRVHALIDPIEATELADSDLIPRAGNRAWRS